MESEGPDPLLTIADEVKSELGQSVAPGAWAVDILPICTQLLVILYVTPNNIRLTFYPSTLSA